MKRSLSSKLSLIFLCATILGNQTIALAATRPYFKTYGGDIMAGGWTDVGNSPCDTTPTTYYQDPFFSQAGYPTNNHTGGILSYMNNSSGNSAGGSSSQFAAYALGIIERTDANNWGFYSSGVSAPSSPSVLAFSNQGLAGSWGGQFDGSTPQRSCIPDYYSKLPGTATTIASLNSSTASDTYKMTTSSNVWLNGAPGAGDTVIGADSSSKGKQVTIYVDGNIFIGNNIKYATDTVDNVPKFSLVVRGSIYIDKSVTEIDGLYVAQPKYNAGGSLPSGPYEDNGNIWTCHAFDTNPVYYTFPATCTNSLVVNGALIAKEVDLLRVKGDIATANTAEDAITTFTNCQATPAACPVAEIINYSPSVVLGGSYFASTSSSTNSLPTESLKSLPPVF